ncbi:YitT family protein [Paenibacillus sp. MBLB4367]|uniref:YitT family protein n=1 Tax=Paenibacillus sp. MBLB4367 TaxID=3384767 RepID=UPI0039082704
MSLLPKALAVIGGSMAVAIGVDLFLVPYKLLDGGMIGIGLLLKYYFGFRPGTSIIFASLPIFLFAFLNQKSLFLRSVAGFLVSSYLIDVLSPLSTLLELPVMLHAVYGGALIGTGIGLMLAYGINTGGTDLLAMMLSMRSGIPTAVLIFVIDFTVLLTGITVIGAERTLYSMITIFFVAVFTYYFSNRPAFGK